MTKSELEVFLLVVRIFLYFVVTVGLIVAFLALLNFLDKRLIGWRYKKLKAVRNEPETSAQDS